MTINRMGLEQTLSDERLEEVISGGILFCDEQRDMARESLAYRKASKDPVAWVRYCSDGTIDGPLMNYQIEDCRKSTWTPLFAAPPLQAVTVPDEPTDNERIMEIEGISVVRLPPEFYSEHGVVVQLEKVMAALSVHGIKYHRPQIQPQNIPEIIPGTCNWSPDDNGIWGGTCGITWQFFDDGPAENGAKYCPSCGGLIAVSESVTNEP